MKENLPERFERGEAVTAADGRQGTVRAFEEKDGTLVLRLRASQRVVRVSASQVVRGWHG